MIIFFSINKNKELTITYFNHINDWKNHEKQNYKQIKSSNKLAFVKINHNKNVKC